MNATQAPVMSLSILAPCAALPAEGEEIESLVAKENDATSLLRAFQAVVSAKAPAFLLKNGDVAWLGDIEKLSALQLVAACADEDSGRLEFETRFASSRMNWADVMSATSQAISSEHFISSPAELLRVFATCVRDAARDATVAFLGDPIPLLTVERDAKNEMVTVRFLGIWLAAEGAAAGLRDGDSCILLDKEAEGRGMKEIVMSAAMLAMVFEGTASAADARATGPQKTSWFASLFGGGNGERAGKGEVLKVTSQRLVQLPPRIYRSVLDNGMSGGLKVIVDIGDQRAYLVRGGQVAFETPISTAQAGRWTPRGTYSITEKVRSGKTSTIYNCALPGWMRVGETAIGMHEGMLPGYPASHGCIRMPIESAHFIFDHAQSGTTVQIVDDWSPHAQQPQGAMVAQN